LLRTVQLPHPVPLHQREVQSHVIPVGSRKKAVDFLTLSVGLKPWLAVFYRSLESPGWREVVSGLAVVSCICYASMLLCFGRKVHLRPYNVGQLYLERADGCFSRYSQVIEALEGVHCCSVLWDVCLPVSALYEAAVGHDNA
jgi:hypothetical protein